ncbi:MAG: HAD family hydrolase [Candidatus Heimdallarchaeota archaeon]|nr:HAD family hydrolase [Candidatus Heimdallarchaeota archaeon]
MKGKSGISEKIPIFWDLGGTLMDTVEVSKAAFKSALGKDLSTEQMKRLYKDLIKSKRGFRVFFKWPVISMKLSLHKKKVIQIEKELFLTHTQLVPGAKEFFKQLINHKELINTVVTQNPHLTNENYGEKLLTSLFDGEPHPFDFVLAGKNKSELIINRFDSQTIARGIFIGDMNNDILVAKNLGIPGIGVLWGYSNAAELETTLVAKDFDELYEIIVNHSKSLASNEVF